MRRSSLPFLLPVLVHGTLLLGSEPSDRVSVQGLSGEDRVALGSASPEASVFVPFQDPDIEVISAEFANELLDPDEVGGIEDQGLYSSQTPPNVYQPKKKRARPHRFRTSGLKYGSGNRRPSSIRYGSGMRRPSNIRYGSGNRRPSAIRYGSGNRRPSNIRYGSGNRRPSKIRYGSGNRRPSDVRYGQ